jgi:glycosyltransferase involved in cell wall biosynthesis
VCAGFRDRLNLVTACSSREFHIPRARNLAMRNAVGDVIVQIDADTMLAPEALQRLYDYCFAFGQRVCAVGQVVGYDNNTGGDIESVELVGREYLACFDVQADVRILPLTGIALPFEPGEVASCRVGPRIRLLPDTYRDAVLAEAERVSKRVIVHGGAVVDDDRS